MVRELNICFTKFRGSLVDEIVHVLFGRGEVIEVLVGILKETSRKLQPQRHTVPDLMHVERQ